MNTVEIDEAALLAEADAAVEAVGTVETVPGVAMEPVPSSWGPFLAGMVPMLRAVVLPQWKFAPGQIEELEASLTVCLDQAFPGGLDGKYACWVRLGMCGTGIVITNIAMNGGKLPPLGPPRAEPDEEETTGTNGAQGGEKRAAA